jgi:hypothetical protein
VNQIRCTSPVGYVKPMNHEKSKFSLANLTSEERELRQLNIEALQKSLAASHPDFSLEDAEAVYDHMQQAAIECGKSIWQFYKEN